MRVVVYVIHHKAYKFRIEPNSEQKEQINKTIGCCRWVYNYFLDKAKESKYKSWFEYKKQLPGLKKEYEWLKEADSIALQQSLKDLDRAFQNFFNGKQKYPRFKSKKHSRLSYRTQYNQNNIRIKDNKIKLPKLGWVKFRKSQEVCGEIKNVTVSKSRTGKYYISVCVEENIEPLPEVDKAVGIDLGLEHFAVTSHGDKVENPRTLEKYQRKIRRLQKDLARKEKGSNNWKKKKRELAKVHEKVANIRKDFLHKLSTTIIRENQTVTVESLKVKNMLKNKNLSRSISDASWSMFVGFLEYKADWYGRDFVKIETWFPSSQLCNQCGYQNKDLTLKVRRWTCPECNTDHDRDINASKNILGAGLELQL